MNRSQFVIAMAVMGVMSLAGSFLAVYVLQSDQPLQAQDKKVVTASEFRLVDDNGKLRSLMTIDKGGDLLFTMLDAKEKVRMTQSVGNDGSSAIVLSSADGKARMSLTSDASQPGAFTVFDSKGEAAALLAIGNDDFPMLTLMRDKSSLLTGIAKGGKGLIAMSDAGGQFFSVTGGGDDPSSIILNHNGAGTNCMLTTTSDGTMQLSMKEKDDLLAFLNAGGKNTASLQVGHSSGSLVRLQAQGSGVSLMQLGSGENYARVMRSEDGSSEFAIVKEKKYAWKEAGK